MATALIWLLAAVLIIIGIAGMILPVLPGPILLWAGLAAAAWAEHFVYVGTWTLLALAALALLAHLLDFIAGSLGAKRYGASRRAIFGAALGAVVGLFFGLIGILIGPFIGALVGEWSVQRNLGAAGRAGVGATIGMLVGTAAKLAIGITMIGMFLFVRFV